jgi:hypothetical protein
MPQLETVVNPCPECFDAFAKQRTHFCKEIVRHQRDYFAQQHEIKSLQAELKHALEALAQPVQPDPVLAEREACAKLAEKFEPDEKTSYVIYASTAIRARGVMPDEALAQPLQKQSCSPA